MSVIIHGAVFAHSLESRDVIKEELERPKNNSIYLPSWKKSYEVDILKEQRKSKVAKEELNKSNNEILRLETENVQLKEQLIEKSNAVGQLKNQLSVKRILAPACHLHDWIAFIRMGLLYGDAVGFRKDSNA